MQGVHVTAQPIQKRRLRQCRHVTHGIRRSIRDFRSRCWRIPIIADAAVTTTERRHGRCCDQLIRFGIGDVARLIHQGTLVGPLVDNAGDACCSNQFGIGGQGGVNFYRLLRMEQAHPVQTRTRFLLPEARIGQYRGHCRRNAKVTFINISQLTLVQRVAPQPDCQPIQHDILWRDFLSCRRDRPIQ